MPKNATQNINAESHISAEDVRAKYEEVEHLVQEFHRLQVHYEEAFQEEGLREEVEALEHWAESYRRGLRAAVKISQNGQTILEKVRQRLKLAADELTRISSESPNPLTPEDEKKAEDFMEANRSIDQILPAVEHAVGSEHEKTNENNPETKKGE